VVVTESDAVGILFMDLFKFLTVSSDNLFNTRMNMVIWIIEIYYKLALCTFATHRLRWKQKKHLHISYCQFVDEVSNIFLMFGFVLRLPVQPKVNKCVALTCYSYSL